ncbi:MAG: hypothetical protein M1469_06550 [Bacteroidetes bacterium]|nr:hypothetical protein [Bacteroidota bacterium]
MLTVAIVLFTLAIFAGVILLTVFFLDGKTPRGFARVHGVIAVVALILVIVFFSLSNTPPPFAGMMVLVIAALIGFTLFKMGQKDRRFPKWLPILHGFVAAVGFVILLLSL